MHFCMFCKQQNAFFSLKIFTVLIYMHTCKLLSVVHKGSIFHVLVYIIVGQ